jgi:hypothetical protein
MFAVELLAELKGEGFCGGSGEFLYVRCMRLGRVQVEGS